MLLTGKNGVGKTTLLQEIKMFIKSIQYNKLLERVICWNKVKDEYNQLKYKSVMEQYTSTINMDSCCIKDFGPGVEIDFSVIDDLEYLHKKGNFVLAYYSDNRSTSVVIPHSSERIILSEKYFIDEEPSDIFVKYLVDLKTQQAFARNEGELEVVENIEAWFNNFENALKDILEFLTTFFPNIQFIVTTHSPFVLNSIKNTVVYDLEKNIRIENLSDYSYDGIVEGYFEVDNYSNELKKKIEEYKSLALRNDLTDDERARRAELRIELKDIPSDLAREVKAEFNDIEEKRKNLR